MRTLRFIVNGQNIERDPKCNWEGIHPGTIGYLKCEFTFDSTWDGFSRAVAFHDVMGREYTPCFLKDGTHCMPPTDILKFRVFKIQVVGKKDEETILTNKVEIHQNGGKHE